MSEMLLPGDIAQLAAKVVEANAASGRKVVLAESCTGGLVSGALTEIPGSSSVLDRGFVTYSNEAKMEMLDVPSDIIETFGAVSIACVWAMAQGALKHSGADIAVAISGVAAPAEALRPSRSERSVSPLSGIARTSRRASSSSSAMWDARKSAVRRRFAHWNCYYRKARPPAFRTRSPSCGKPGRNTALPSLRRPDS